ncbi:Glycosyltransferase involved in cell wall bisynthesis [Ruminococcus sp. YE71]|uniref:glycosyltransferase n=1 Tax=unclassified Ruminococcus TaxID=2608920 RepID=UPI00087EC617|nr:MULTISPECIES: glycosyltransferase [unclassified Ruminococcus]SDA30807.1 Glycosyltransferase involved in cell wall bisynthesis [Ruminococcus sp. YE78]SFW50498.1 Glycosyltransferase involved in cell wall bisynthesis [Ruminococcus sp. YE71]
MNICIVNCFDTYEHRVDLLFDTFKAQGHKVIVLSSDFRHIDKVKRTEKKSGYKFFAAIPYTKNLSVTRMRSHNCFSKDVSRYIERHINKIDLIWALIPPNSLVKDISKIKNAHPRVKLIYDLIDLWPETMPVGNVKAIFPFTYWKNLRDRHLRSADCIVTECNLYRKKLKNVLSGMKVETLYLARPFIEYTPHLHLPEDKIALCYLGSINNIIDIDTIVKIVKQIQMHKPVSLHIIGDGENREKLISGVKAAGAEVIYHGKVYDRTEKQQILDGCHYGLNIMKDTVCVGLTMKSMDYFEMGLPIINNIHGDTWDFVNKYNVGINYKVGKDLDLNSIGRETVTMFFKGMLTTESFERKVKGIIE